MERPSRLSIEQHDHDSLDQPLQRLRLPRAWAIIGSALFLGLVFCVDNLTPKELAFSYYYALPVLVVTWFSGRRAGFLFVALTLTLWTWAEILEHTYGAFGASAIINVTTRGVALCMFVLLLASFKDLSTRLGALVEERTQALRQMATRLADAEDTERQRLATDLHDGLGQMLLLLKLNLSAMFSESQDNADNSSRIRQAIDMVDNLIHKSRTLTFDLHPVMLDHLGLVPTLRQFGEDFARQTNIELTINEEGAQRPLDRVVARHLFRSLKELIGNAVRHGPAGQIVVSVYWMPDSLRLIVDDDGRGFDSTQALAPKAHKGLGLPSINERLRSLGGSMEIESNTQTGTRVVLELPLVARENTA
jgi:signal transduction histidine kinase